MDSAPQQQPHQRRYATATLILFRPTDKEFCRVISTTVTQLQDVKHPPSEHEQLPRAPFSRRTRHIKIAYRPMAQPVYNYKLLRTRNVVWEITTTVAALRGCQSSYVTHPIPSHPQTPRLSQRQDPFFLVWCTEDTRIRLQTTDTDHLNLLIFLGCPP